MIEDIVFLSEKINFKANPAREEKWQTESKMAVKRRLHVKVALNRRSPIGKPFGWPLELFTRKVSPPKVQLIPEPEAVQPIEESRRKDLPQNDPLSRFKQWRDSAPKRPRRPQEDLTKAMMTETTTVVGDDEISDMIEEELYDRKDEDDLVPETEPAFDFQKMEEDRSRRIELARFHQTDDSHLLAQVFDSCPLQGATGLAAAFGEFFPWMVDAGNDQAAHIFWHGEEVCPQLQDHWAANNIRHANHHRIFTFHLNACFF